MKYNLTLLVICLVACPLLFTSCMYSKKYCRNALAKASTQSYDMIVVPGAPMDNKSLNRVLKARIYWAKYLFDKGIAKNIMFSGSAVYSPYYEGEMMAMYAEGIGVPKEHIYTETKAEHSTENIYYSYKKAKKMGFQKIALATDPFQAKLMHRFMKKKVSKEIANIPVAFDTIKMLEPTMINPVLDTQRAFVKDFVSLPSRENWFKRFRGTLGKNINKTYYENGNL
ncbi:MAG: YdcF family protein [Chitinophagales bacterium]